jgi:hypothetical protein
MKNLTITYRISLFLIAILYLLYRVTNVYLVTPFFDEFDSPAYFKLEFFPSFRTHGITLLFAILKNELWISVFQSVVGAITWIYLWITCLNQLQHKFVKIIFTLLYFILACSSVIVEHDSSIMSESLAISSTVFLIAAAINLYISAKSSNRISLAIFGLAIVWFGSTKSSNSIITPILLVFFLWAIVKHKPNVLELVHYLFVIFLGFFLFTNALSSDISKTLNTSGTINNRLIYVEEWKNQLIESGYPISAFSTFDDYSLNNLGVPPDQAVVNLPEFKKWWDFGGDSFLLKFTIKNLDYALVAPIATPVFSEELNFRKSLLSGWSQGTDLSSEFAGFEGSILKRSFFWPDEPEKAYLALAISILFFGISLCVFNYFGYLKEYNLFIFIIFIAIIWSYLNWWFGSKPIDMARHNLSAAVIFKLIPLISICLSLEKRIPRNKM